jgi:hypothetical protein
VVRISAWLAARRAARRLPLPPMSRNEKTVVSSQNTYSSSRSSATTRPSIEPAKAVRLPAKRAVPSSPGSK